MLAKGDNEGTVLAGHVKKNEIPGQCFFWAMRKRKKIGWILRRRGLSKNVGSEF